MFYNLVLASQIMSILILFFLVVYVSFQRISRLQILMMILCTSTLLNFSGYLFELMADCKEAAILGTTVAYMGKPFSLLSSFLFVAEYCGRRIPKRWTVALTVYLAAFPVIVATNRYHHLYYSTVNFDRSRILSPLILGHGPLYFVYIGTTVTYLVACLYIALMELRASKDKNHRSNIFILMGLVVSSMAGYLLFLTGITKGYDATMAGSFIGVILLLVLFFKGRIFDALTLAKEQALKDSISGLLVFDTRDRKVYSNTFINVLMAKGLTLSEMKNIPQGKSLLMRDSRVYEAVKNTIVNGGRCFGETIELTDITEKYNYSARLEKDVEERTKELRRIQHTVLGSFAGIVEARDSSTGDHIRRIANYVQTTAESLRSKGIYTDVLTDEYITRLVDVSPLHDIGKIAIPDNVLQKPGKLTVEEFEIIKTHAQKGADIIDECLRGVESEEYVLMAEQVAKSHHECWDGTGYPEGLSGEKIPLSARMVSVADVYDAVRSERCYKPAMSAQEAQKLIADWSGTHFDPLVAQAFLDEIRKTDK